MTKETKKLETWEEVIVDFFENKVENITNKPKVKCLLFNARKFIDEKSKNIKQEKDAGKIKKLEKEKEDKEKELNQLRLNAPSIEIRQWIEKTCNTKIAEGKRIIKSTHVLKFSHGLSESGGLLLKEKLNEAMLTTSSLKKNLTYDLAHNNGNLITLSRFLALELSGKLIIDLILNDDFTFLKSFCENNEQLDKWKKGFVNLVEQREIKTADKAKQIYFPCANVDDKAVSSETKYHLIIPLFSSSMAEEIYNMINILKYGKEQKEVRDCRKVSGDSTTKSTKYHSKEYIDVPNLGVQKFGGAQPQNISMLNKNRSGQCFLFSSQPPIWQSQLKAPIYKKSLFDDRFFSQNTKTEIDYLRDFLLRFEHLDLSIKRPERRKWIDKWVGNIIDDLLFYAASVQNMPAGWSNVKDIKLKPAHQYFLDPYRENEAFQIERNATDWQAVVCDDFASWLNRRLVGKDKKFTPQRIHTRMWRNLLKQPLREFNQMIEAESKYQTKELI